MKATERDIKNIDSLYEGRRAFHGELHDHAATGGTSDGMRSLEHWRGAMEALKLLLSNKLAMLKLLFSKRKEDKTIVVKTVTDKISQSLRLRIF